MQVQELMEGNCNRRKVCGRIKLRVALAYEEKNHGDVHNINININIGDAEWHFGRFAFVKV